MGWLATLFAFTATFGLIVALNSIFSEKASAWLEMDAREAKTYFFISSGMFVVALIVAGSS